MTHITSTIEPNHGVGCIIGSFPDTKQKEPKVHDSHQQIKDLTIHMTKITTGFSLIKKTGFYQRYYLNLEAIHTVKGRCLCSHLIF